MYTRLFHWSIVGSFPFRRTLIHFIRYKQPFGLSRNSYNDNLAEEMHCKALVMHIHSVQTGENSDSANLRQGQNLTGIVFYGETYRLLV